MFESPEGLELIRRTRANIAFVSAAGVCKKFGVTCVNQYEIETKLATIQSAYTKVLLADSTKFATIRPAYFADISDFDIIITDSGITPDWVEFVESKGITLHVV